jgi:hypothetical protein
MERFSHCPRIEFYRARRARAKARKTPAGAPGAKAETALARKGAPT